MVKWFLAVLLIFLAIAGLYWWLYWPQRQALEAANRQLAGERQTVSELRGRVDGLEAARGQLHQTSGELRQKVADAEKELASLRSTQDELARQLQQEIADQQVRVERVRDQIRVDMVDEILFDSGEAILKPEGVAVLTKVGGVLSKVTDRRVEVHGHTDNVPIIGALARRFPTNWELSAARATNVARFLQDVARLDPACLTATANSEFHPRASNTDDEGRRLNRRIEILLAPVPAHGSVASASSP
ncbi:MAG TPA: OmpA family protein [Vicinamibacteria bacterium]|nr:OmpA family protein [Vicinamibacteria bacterium]